MNIIDRSPYGHKVCFLQARNTGSQNNVEKINLKFNFPALFIKFTSDILGSDTEK